MKGQGDAGVKVNGEKDQSNNNKVKNKSLEEEDLSEEEETVSAEEGEEEEDENENDEVVNASLVVNLSENNSHLNSLNSFNFSRDLNQNQNSSSTLSTDDSNTSIDSPLASSRSAPPDFRDYDNEKEARAAAAVGKEEEQGRKGPSPAVSQHDQPAFTSTPKQQTNVQLPEVNGSSTETPRKTVPEDDPAAVIKKKHTVTFADIVKQNNAEDKKLPPYILSDEEGTEEEELEQELSESVYFSMGQTPPSNNASLVEKPSGSGPAVENDVVNGSNNSANENDDSLLNESGLNDRSELDIASISAQQVNGSEESSDTLINVSNWNTTVNNSAAAAPSDVSASPVNLLAAPHRNGSGDHIDLDISGNVDDAAADEEVHKINANLLLPNTVTELVASNGVKVYVVGTAHFSEQSQHDVVETIQKLNPTLVVLELCHSRRNILTLDEETILRESADMSLVKVREAINQSGAVQGTLHLLLLSMSAQLTKKLGMAPGGEFRAAVREARTIPGCLLLLGDRPFKVTLSRALAALSFGQKLKLAWQFLTSNDDITKDEIERCKEKDLLERMMMEMTGEFPAISRVFVSERDIYLAHSLWLAATSTSHKNQGGPIVGVVGMGHVSGIVQNWGNTTEEQIANLMIIPEPSVTSIIVRATVKYSFYALLGYGVYKLSRRLFDFPSNGIVQSAWDRMPQISTKSIGISR